MYDNTYKGKGSKSPFIELHSEEQQVRSLPLPHAATYSKKHGSLYKLEKAQGIHREHSKPQPHPILHLEELCVKLESTAK